jgi:hypothetical protein
MGRMLLLHTCGCASLIQSGPPPSFSRATLAPSASARTEARSHRGYLHIFREQSAVPLDLIRCFPFNGLRHPPRATLLLPGRVRLQPPHYNSSCIARDLPAHRHPARCAAAPPLPAAEPVFARPCRITSALAHACSRHLGLLLPRPSHSRTRQPRLQCPPRALRSTLVHTANFHTPSRARSRQPLDVAHVRSCTAREPPECPLAACCFICAPTTPAFTSARAAPELPRCRTRLARIACSCSSLHCSCFQCLPPLTPAPATLRCPYAWPLPLGPLRQPPPAPTAARTSPARPRASAARRSPRLGRAAWARSPACASRSPPACLPRRSPAEPRCLRSHARAPGTLPRLRLSPAPG